VCGSQVNKKTADEAVVLKDLLHQWWAEVLTPLKEQMSSTPITHPKFDERIRKSLAKAMVITSAVKSPSTTLYYTVRDNAAGHARCVQRVERHTSRLGRVLAVLFQ
jgi:hypothetical protein